MVIAVYKPKFGANVDTILRTADIMGVEKVIIIDAHEREWRQKALNTSKCDTRKKNPLPLIKMTTQEFLLLGERYYAVDNVPNRIAVPLNNCEQDGVFVFGGEDCGLSQELLDNAYEIVTIPFGRWSMNVAQAAAMVMWQIKGVNNGKQQ